MTHVAPRNLRVELEPYPHLRDLDGCILANDYLHAEKLAFILRAVNSHAALVEALANLECALSDMLDRNTVNFTDAGMGENEIDSYLAKARAALKLAKES